MFFEILTIVRDPGIVLGFDMVEAVGESHVAKSLMMTVGLAIGSDVNDLRPVPAVIECGEQSLCKTFSAVQQSPKGNILGDRAIMEEEVDGLL